MRPSDPYVLWLEDCDASRASAVGGKCAGLGEMIKAGVTVNDLVTGIRELRSKPKYKIAGPWSVINAAVIAMSNRLARDNPSAYPSTKAALEEMGYVIRE